MLFRSGILANAGMCIFECRTIASFHSPHLLDSISFYTFKLGLMYLGLTPFPISIRNSAIAIAYFVRTLGIQQMFVSVDPAMQRLARDTNALLAEEGKEFELLPMPTFEDLYGAGGDAALVPMGKVSPDKTCIIIHSSGESGPAGRWRSARSDRKSTRLNSSHSGESRMPSSA